MVKKLAIIGLILIPIPLAFLINTITDPLQMGLGFNELSKTLFLELVPIALGIWFIYSTIRRQPAY